MTKSPISIPPRVLVGVMTLAAFLVRLLQMLQVDVPSGTDGFLYAEQVRHILMTGRPHMPDGSWVPWFLSFTALLTGDVIAGIKLGSAFLAAATVPAAAMLGGTLDKAQPRASILLAAWCAASPTVTHLANDFPRNVGMAAPLLVFLSLLTRTAPMRSHWVGLVVSALLTATAHKTGAALVVLCVVGALVAGRLRAAWLPALSVVAVLFLLLGSLVPNLLHPSDLERLHVNTDAMHLPPPFPYFALRHTHPLQQLELASPWLALAITPFLWRGQPALRPLIGACVVTLLVLLSPTWPVDSLDVGYRLALLAPLPGAVLLAAFIPSSRVPQLALVPLALASTTGFDVHNHPPWEQYRSMVAAIPRPLPDLVIAHRMLSFLYVFETGEEAMAWAPEPRIPRRSVGRVVWGVEDGEWLGFEMDHPKLPRHRRLAPRHAWVREDAFEALVEWAQGRPGDLPDRLLDPRNPREVRPEYLLRNH